MSELTTVSIVASGKIHREFELTALAKDIESYSSEYSESKHPGLYLKFYEDGPTVIIYRSGACSIRGGSSIEEIYENKRLVEDKLSRLGIDGSITDFRLSNVVFTADLMQPVNLNELSVKLGLENIEYEPEQFPGLIYRLERGVILIFASGKLVLTGFTDKDIAAQALKRLTNLVNY